MNALSFFFCSEVIECAFRRRTIIPSEIIKTPARKNSTLSHLFGKPKEGSTATKVPASMMRVSRDIGEIYHS